MLNSSVTQKLRDLKKPGRPRCPGLFFKKDVKTVCYCDMCNSKVVGLNKDAKRVIQVKGTNINVSYKGIFCERCGSELFDEDIEDSIYKDAIEKYRQTKHLLQPSVIESALKKMGPEELAAKAGCAVRELIGASHGGLQSVETDRKLRAVLSA